MFGINIRLEKMDRLLQQMISYDFRDGGAWRTVATESNTYNDLVFTCEVSLVFSRSSDNNWAH